MEAYFILIVIGIIAFVILWAEHALENKTALFLSALLILAAMVLRGLCLEHETLDYQNFLTRWVQLLKDQGGFRGLRWNIGNYNVPYLYFLAAFTYIDIRDLYLIKLLSIFFDVILAWGVMRLTYCFTDRTGRVLGAFFVTLFLPTVVLNGAYWAQCDSIYVAFAVWSLYFALRDKPVLSILFIAISFSFKLQAVFLMPVFLVFLFAKKLKWYHFPIFPLTYIVMVLPAILAGRSAKSTILLYFNQAGSVGSGLNYNSPSAYAFVRSAADPDLLSKIGIVAAFVFLIILFIFCYFRRRELSQKTLLACALLITIAVPFLLPHMHDRYFFAADVLSLAFAFVFPRLVHVPILTSFASLLGYHAYLRGYYLMPMRYGSWALLAVIVTLIIALSVFLSPRTKKSGR